MNGVHDMGGMTCYGRVVREDNEPCFHAHWERRVFGMTMLAIGQIETLDAFRHAIERMDPTHYLSSTYYEHWLAALEMLAVEKGLLSPEELARGALRSTGGATAPPLPPEAVRQVVAQGAPCDRTTGRLTPHFAPGDRVRAKNVHPVGHTRLPRYARGKVGVIDRVHGTFIYPDTNAHGGGEQPQPVYCVQFEARELWGPQAPRKDRVRIDLWEDYLEPA
jgi:nitrile hydratase